MSIRSMTVSRPQRWDVRFGADMTDAAVDGLLARPEIAAISADNFPQHVSLRGILLNDARIVAFEPGDIVVREGDYGSSAFLILSGQLRVVLAPGLPGDALGRQPALKRTFLETLSQLWTNRRIPEVRDPQRYRDRHLASRRAKDGAAR
ncbi:MAG: hypothetical protein FJX55_21215, partial [Alphaproteobacteria bacterium]|nr:hypothetical protein [Alphaproteobacteria bacterium]